MTCIAEKNPLLQENVKTFMYVPVVFLNILEECFSQEKQVKKVFIFT